MPKKTYTCNCPDFMKRQDFVLGSDYLSQTVTRDWSDSEAGVGEGYCKHIWATRLARGEITKQDIPTDIPVEKTDAAQERTPVERYQDGYGGSDFSGGWGVRQPRQYKGG